MSNGDDIMDPGDSARVTELTALLPGLDPDDQIAVQAEIDSISEKYKAGGGYVGKYAGGGYVPRGTIAGEIDRRGDMSVREEGETMYELAKRRGDERTYMANGGEVDMSRRARRMYATGTGPEGLVADRREKLGGIAGEIIDKAFSITPAGMAFKGAKKLDQMYNDGEITKAVKEKVEKFVDKQVKYLAGGVSGAVSPPPTTSKAEGGYIGKGSIPPSYATGGLFEIDTLDEDWDELDEDEQEAIIESISDVLPGGKDGGEVKKKRKKKKKKKSVSVKSSSVDGVGAGKSRGGGAAIRGLIFRGIF